jgi:bacteriocin-like protein
MSEMRELTTTELDAVSGGWGFFEIEIANGVGNHVHGQNVQIANVGVNFGNQSANQNNVNGGH